MDFRTFIFALPLAVSVAVISALAGGDGQRDKAFTGGDCTPAAGTTEGTRSR